MGKPTYSWEERLSIGGKHEKELDGIFSGTCHVSQVDSNLQALGIDRIFIDKNPPHERFSVEYKTDLKAHETKSAFIEIVSNTNKNKAGWAYTTCAQTIIYYTPGTGRIFCLYTNDLKEALGYWEHEYPVRECKNKTYEAKGILVPLKEIQRLSYSIWDVA
jgi:hypothetical protein